MVLGLGLLRAFVLFFIASRIIHHVLATASAETVAVVGLAVVLPIVLVGGAQAWIALRTRWAARRAVRSSSVVTRPRLVTSEPRMALAAELVAIGKQLEEFGEKPWSEALQIWGRNIGVGDIQSARDFMRCWRGLSDLWISSDTHRIKPKDDSRVNDVLQRRIDRAMRLAALLVGHPRQ